MSLTLEDIEKMQAVDIQRVDINTLTELSDIVIDSSKPVKERIKQYAEQTNNLFIHRIGDYVVKVSYDDTKDTLNDKMENYIRKLAEVNY